MRYEVYLLLHSPRSVINSVIFLMLFEEIKEQLSSTSLVSALGIAELLEYPYTCRSLGSLLNLKNVIQLVKILNY